jgi:hypothetical protein
MSQHHSPFDLDNDDAYQAWREKKLASHPRSLEDLLVEVNDPRDLTAAEEEAMRDLCRRANMVIYVGKTGSDPDKEIPRRLGERFGLVHLDHNRGADDDAITSLTVVEGGYHGEYIPYSNRPIHWHTDGYYNLPERQIMGLLLHCVNPAMEGGENALMDHEMAYILLRDRDPELIRALMQPDAMLVPANVKNGVELRPDRAGPVFSVTDGGWLHMRYTARARNIVWKEDDATQAARQALSELLASDSPYIFRGTLQAGWGLVSNNVLHDRSGFNDDEESPRLLYRARYYDRISGT